MSSHLTRCFALLGHLACCLLPDFARAGAPPPCRESLEAEKKVYSSLQWQQDNRLWILQKEQKRIRKELAKDRDRAAQDEAQDLPSFSARQKKHDTHHREWIRNHPHLAEVPELKDWDISLRQQEDQGVFDSSQDEEEAATTAPWPPGTEALERLSQRLSQVFPSLHPRDRHRMGRDLAGTRALALAIHQLKPDLHDLKKEFPLSLDLVETLLEFVVFQLQQAIQGLSMRSRTTEKLPKWTHPKRAASRLAREIAFVLLEQEQSPTIVDTELPVLFQSLFPQGIQGPKPQGQAIVGRLEQWKSLLLRIISRGKTYEGGRDYRGDGSWQAPPFPAFLDAWSGFLKTQKNFSSEDLEGLLTLKGKADEVSQLIRGARQAGITGILQEEGNPTEMGTKAGQISGRKDP